MSGAVRLTLAAPVDYDGPQVLTSAQPSIHSQLRNEMAITIHCPCSRVLTVSDTLAGRPTRCPSCGRRHIVPEAPVAPPAPDTAELGEIACRECGTRLLKTAAFCHCCGLPTDAPKPEAGPVRPEPPGRPLPPPTPAEALRHAHQMRKVIAPPPVPPPPPAPKPPTPPAPPQQAGPFGERAAAASTAKPFAAPPRKGDDGPFVSAVAAKRRLKSSGLGRLAMTFAFISGLLAIFNYAFVYLPLMYHQASLSPGDIGTLAPLAGRLGGITMLFSFAAVVMGFLGMFHFGRRRAGAIVAMLIALLIGGAVSSSTKQLAETYPGLVKFGCSAVKGDCSWGDQSSERETVTEDDCTYWKSEGTIAKRGSSCGLDKLMYGDVDCEPKSTCSPAKRGVVDDSRAEDY
jgi:DNA-directed RNA polymerase subunit RPC12/RpoP